MTVVLVNDSGEVVDCVITNITETKVHRTPIHDTPASTGDIIQSLGTRSRTFSLKGVVTGSHGVSQVRALPGVTGSLTFTDYLGGESIPETEVFFTEVRFSDKGDKPTIREFNLDAIEVV